LAGGNLRRLSAVILMFTAERVAGALKKTKKQADGSWIACCPAHNDRNPSLSIEDGDDVPVVLYCHAGCEYSEIAEALDRQHGIKLGNAGGVKGDTQRNLAPTNWPSTYRYFDENGIERYVVCRQYNENSGKTFKQIRPDGKGGYALGIEGIERLPYRLPFWKDCDSIVIVEGEKDVDTLAKYGIAATCNSGGANNWKPELNKWFDGKTVYVIPDNDEPGRKHASKVAEQLKGIAAEVFISDICAGMKSKADISDYIVKHKGPYSDKLTGAISSAAVLTADFDLEAPISPKKLCLTVGDWLDREIDPPDFLLGELFSTTSRALLVGPTGAGKTNFGLTLAGHMATGETLLHLDARRSSRILYIDGELSRRWMKRLIADLDRRMPDHTDLLQKNLHVFSLEDEEDMSPLNTLEGQSRVDEVIAETCAEFVFFDNIQALTLGDMKDEVSWSETLPWVRSITARNIGQVWMHHTGHEESRSYGTKTREWQMDTVMLMKKNSDDQIDFNLDFQKARTRTPENRRYFEKVAISLQDDRWNCSAAASGGGKKASPMAYKHHEALLNVMIHHGKPMHGVDKRPNSVTVEQWKQQLETQGFLEAHDDQMSKGRYRASYAKYKNELISANMIAIQNDRVWSISSTVAEG
jgi:5S rRNA maturation endonuclease (ribonuclease M5)